MRRGWGRGGGRRAIPKISKWKTNFAKLEKFEVFGSRPMTRRVIISEIGLRKSSRKKKKKTIRPWNRPVICQPKKNLNLKISYFEETEK